MTDFIGPNGERYSTNSIRARISQAAQQAADRIIQQHELTIEGTSCASAISAGALSCIPNVRAASAGLIEQSMNADAGHDSHADTTLHTINCVEHGRRRSRLEQSPAGVARNS